MRTRLLLAAAVLAALPSLAIAECVGGHSNDIVMSCPEGQTYDADTRTCIPPTTG